LAANTLGRNNGRAGDSSGRRGKRGDEINVPPRWVRRAIRKPKSTGGSHVLSSTKNGELEDRKPTFQPKKTIDPKRTAPQSLAGITKTEGIVDRRLNREQNVRSCPRPTIEEY